MTVVVGRRASSSARRCAEVRDRTVVVRLVLHWRSPSKLCSMNVRQSSDIGKIVGLRASSAGRVGDPGYLVAAYAANRTPTGADSLQRHTKTSRQTRDLGSDHRRVQVGVHEREADSSTSLVFTVPPTGIEPATFGTGNQRLSRSEHAAEPNSRVIPRELALAGRVCPGALRVHLRAHPCYPNSTRVESPYG